MGIMRLKSSSSTDEREKIKTKIVSPLTATTPIIIPSIDLSEDSEDDASRKTGVAHVKTFKLCDVCSDASSTSMNALLECEDCGKAIHQKCNRPEVTPAQARDPRFLFVCCNCKDRDTKAERSGCGSMMAKPQSAISSKKVLYFALAFDGKKRLYFWSAFQKYKGFHWDQSVHEFIARDDKAITQKPPSDLSTAWATFAAKKSSHVKQKPNNGMMHLVGTVLPGLSKKPVNTQGSFGTVSRVGSIVGSTPKGFPSFSSKEKK
uniref:PHD-type domain-containing protein n=1 Tax=Ascaris lumbricoides TaxID=6252 RepID=A0A0M3IEZ9_ASCLU